MFTIIHVTIDFMINFFKLILNLNGSGIENYNRQYKLTGYDYDSKFSLYVGKAYSLKFRHD